MHGGRRQRWLAQGLPCTIVTEARLGAHRQHLGAPVAVEVADPDEISALA
jgi:hypothetical protein